jgi:hypothetical protein
MQDIYLDHPTEEALERFVLNHADEKELEIVETHILACASCVTRLEDLELQITATKLALQQVRSEQLAKQATKKTASWKTWATVPGLSLAGGLAALTLGVLLVPQFAQKQPADVALSAYRGLENFTVPEGRPLHISLNANDLNNGPVAVELLNESGRKLWQGSSSIQGDKVEVSVPQISERGTHFLRLYASKSGQTEGDLLREFAFQVK